MPADGIWTGHNGSLGDAAILDERALEFEWTQAIVRTFENVVCSPDISEVSVFVAMRHIPGAVVASRKALPGEFSVIQITGHQARGFGIALHCDLSIVAFVAIWIE